jgi:hypothetical protein
MRSTGSTGGKTMARLPISHRVAPDAVTNARALVPCAADRIRPPADIRRRWGFVVLCAVVLVAFPRRAEAYDFSLGFGVGGMLAGVKPHLALSPRGDLWWRTESGLSLGLHDTANVLFPTGNEGPGVFNETSVLLGYATEKVSFGAGPSLSIYLLPACNAGMTCGRALGISPGGHAQASWYIGERFGLTMSGSVGWVGGTSGPLHDGIAAMLVAGPLLRWSVR